VHSSRRARSPLACLTLVLASCVGPDAGDPHAKIETIAPEPPSEAELEARRAEAERLARRAEERQRHAEAARIRAAEEAQIAAERAAFEAAYPLHGVVYHFIAQVFAAPDGQRPIGYMRRGSQFRAKNGVRGPGCESWHEVPGGGFVCRNKGYLIGETPQTFDPSPRPPALDDALPYLYAYTMRDVVPQYWRLPTQEEEQATETALRAHASRERARQAALAAAPPSSTPATSPDASVEATDDAETPGGSARADAVEAPPPPGTEAEEGTAEAEEDAGDEEGLPEFLRARMLRGFYVSLDREESTEAGRRFYRTVRGGYVRATELRPNEPPESRGVVLGGGWQLPIGVVFRTGARSLRRQPVSGRLVEHGAIARHTALRLADDRMVHEDGVIVREPSVRIIRQRDVPPGVPRDAKWIHVDLSQQSLVAYEGETPVFATLVSTGKGGFETPTGLFRIQSKHVSTTMDDEESAEGAYSIEDVPWTMYFHGNFAIHGAFWHYSFGQVRSHGCVNVSPADARWVFSWSTPTLPASWHGMFASPRQGTFVFIEE
jgi:hypothetical protein